MTSPALSRPTAREASGKTPRSSRPSRKYSTFPNFGFCGIDVFILALAKGALRDRHEMRAGLAVDAVAPARQAVTGTGDR